MSAWRVWFHCQDSPLVPACPEDSRLGFQDKINTKGKMLLIKTAQVARENTLARLIAIAMCGVGLAACSSGTSSSPATSMPMSGQGTSLLVASSDCASYLKSNPDAIVTTTKNYVMVAGRGPSEPMYSREQITALKPTSGELMVSGMMNGMGSMSMTTGTSMSHVEVHICSKATGRAVTGAMPVMTLTREGPSPSTTTIMVAEMTGLDGSTADIHYGNNASMVNGRSYVLRVMLDGQTGTFTMTAPRAGKSGK